MPNPEHLAILKQGVEAWNEWRKSRQHEFLDLSGAELFRTSLSGANLNNVNLSNADLSNCHLLNAYVSNANLSFANLSEAQLGNAQFVFSNLSNANLSGADLSGADLTGAMLNGADLSRAYLANVILIGTDLTDANLDDARMIFANIAGTDLSDAISLDTVEHRGPSSIGIDTLYKSQGKIPDKFMRGAGVPEEVIKLAHSIRAGSSKQLPSCFISYSSKDQPFAERLHADLQSKGVRCWFAPEDLKIGDKIRPTIHESIQNYDKLLLVLSEASVHSTWVEDEVERALATEKEQSRVILFPIRLDDSVMQIKTGWPATVQARHIGDFRNHDAYRESLAKLLKDLKAEVAKSKA